MASDAPRAGSTVSAAAPAERRLRLLVVIVNFRTPELTIQCLQSLRGEVQETDDCRVVVVDNGSDDGSAERIAARVDDEGWRWATVLPLATNGGFSAGNNRGWETAKHAEYVLLLNSDTIVHAGCLAHCCRVMSEDRTIGAMSCLVLNADGSVQNVTRRFPTPLNQWACGLGLPWRWPRAFGFADTEDLRWDRRGTKRDVQWIGGAFMFLRGELLRRVGLLDESFFFYGEDIELCHRVWRSGYRVHYDPGASITHYGGASSDPTRMPPHRQDAHRWEARYLVQRKCHGRVAAWLVRLADLTASAARLGVAWCAGRWDQPASAGLRCSMWFVLRRRT